MNIHLQIERTDDIRTVLTVFLNDKWCGQLCAANEEFDDFATIIESGVRLQPEVNLGTHSYKRTGNTWKESQQAKAALMGN